MSDERDAYHDGERDQRISALEAATRENTKDIKMLLKATYLLWGAIALVQFVFPLAEKYLGVVPK